MNTIHPLPFSAGPLFMQAFMFTLDARSVELRAAMLDVMLCAGKGHLPSACSSIEILRVLYDSVLRYDARNPSWPQRDRCIISKGHASLAVYPLLAEKGFFPRERLASFQRQEDVLTGQVSHHVPGVDFTTGSLGHGLSAGIGMALAAKLQRRASRVFILYGDGEMNEGSTWEALLSAAKHELDNLVLLIDRNWLQGTLGTEETIPLENLAAKLTAFGFTVCEVNGHDVAALEKTFHSLTKSAGAPNAVICHTVKGKGFRSLENNNAWHSRSVFLEEDHSRLLHELRALV